jgi:hypothetical protein
MMVILDYLLDPEDLQRASELDMAIISGTQLDYYLFCGSIIFRVNSTSFDALWKWIPVFDFAIKINEIVSRLVDGEERMLEFTECEATISFARLGADVRITATYTPSIASVPLEELRMATAHFLQKIKNDLLCRFPALSRNVAFRERLALVGISV